MGALWARLSLRVQAGIAVAVPSILIAAFAAIYFPARLNQQAADALQSQAIALAQLAATNAAPTVRLVVDGLAQPEELASLFKGLHTNKDLTSAGVLLLDPARLEGSGPSRALVLGRDDKAQVYGDLPADRYLVAPDGECVTTRGATLDVRCSARDKDTAVLVVLRFSLERFAEQRRDNQVVGLWVLFFALGLGLMLALVFSSAIATPLGVVTRLARARRATRSTSPASSRRTPSRLPPPSKSSLAPPR